MPFEPGQMIECVSESHWGGFHQRPGMVFEVVSVWTGAMTIKRPGKDGLIIGVAPERFKLERPRTLTNVAKHTRGGMKVVTVIHRGSGDYSATIQIGRQQVKLTFDQRGEFIPGQQCPVDLVEG